MRRHDPYFYVEPGVIGPKFTLDRQSSNHLVRVRRARAGDEVLISDGQGTVARCEVTSADESRALLTRLSETRRGPRGIHIHVIQAIAKGSRMDEAITKMVEVGVDEITPAITERCVPRLDDDKAAKAVTRWRVIATEAAGQARRAFLPVVGSIARLDEVEPKPALIVADTSGEASLREVLADTIGTDLTVVIGPEGGLSGAELDRLRLSGGRVFNLGANVLRTETAGLVAASRILYDFGT